MIDIIPKTIQAELRQKRWQSIFTLIAIALCLLIVMAELLKQKTLDLQFSAILIGCLYWHYKLKQEIVQLKQKMHEQ